MFVVKKVPVFHFINICLRCFEKGECAFIIHVENSVFSLVFVIFRLG